MGSLSGIRVLDLSRLIPGPFATMVLADMGADVVRVEEPGGDYLRHMPPMHGDTSGMFLALNRNKRSLVLDLKRVEAKNAVLKLVEKYDVVVEQFRPGVLARLGLSHEALMAKNPRLIVCAITGYGQTGPDAQRAGHDLNYLARSGLLGFGEGTPPMLPGFQAADIAGSLWAVIGILAALQERAGTGRGRVVDIAMVESVMSLGIASFGAMAAGASPKAGAEMLTGGLAFYRTYQTKDGRAVALASLEPKFLMAFAAGVGLEVTMEVLVTGPHQEAWRTRLTELFASRTLSEWTEFSRTHDVCIEPVLAPHELRDDPQLKARGMFFDLPSSSGPVLQWKSPLADRAVHQPPPAAGEHSEQVLQEAGFSAQEIQSILGR